MKPKYNMIFLLTAGGKFNYQGSRQWLEEHVEKQTGNLQIRIAVGGTNDMVIWL